MKKPGLTRTIAHRLVRAMFRAVVCWILVGAASAAIAASGSTDFNGDGKADILWYSPSTGQTSAWLMNGSSPASYAVLLADPNWKVIGTPDLNGDGKSRPALVQRGRPGRRQCGS